jgi:cytochrome c553
MLHLAAMVSRLPSCVKCHRKEGVVNPQYLTLNARHGAAARSNLAHDASVAVRF